MKSRRSRALAERHRVHRRTVRQALADAVPPIRKTPERVLGPHVATIRGWLTADLDAPRKQRHTARRVWQRLMEEEGVVVAESSVRALVAVLRVEVGGDRAQVMVPQTHVAAEEAEVDFGEFTAAAASRPSWPGRTSMTMGSSDSCTTSCGTSRTTRTFSGLRRPGLRTVAATCRWNASSGTPPGSCEPNG